MNVDWAAPVLPRPVFSHIHKNLWLVGNREGLIEAARVVCHCKRIESAPHITNNRMSVYDKFPCVVVLIQVGAGMVEVVSVLTDTTLNHCIREIGALPK